MTSMNYSVQDPYLRDTLITAAEKVEKLLSTKRITLETPLKTETPIGLRIDTILEQKHENDPIIMRFVYLMDDIKFQAWMKEHTYMLSGFASVLTVMGLSILVPGKASSKDGQIDYRQTAFTLEDKNSHGDPISLKLLQKEATFVVHRNPISRKEWSVFLPDSQAAHSRTNEG